MSRPRLGQTRPFPTGNDQRDAPRRLLWDRVLGMAVTRWNGSGFGANDPGRERDTSRPGRFDSDFPIDIDRPLEVDLSGAGTAAEVAARLKSALPYALRFQSATKGGRKPHPELAATMVTMTSEATTPRAALVELTQQLPPGWQATATTAAWNATSSLDRLTRGAAQPSWLSGRSLRVELPPSKIQVHRLETGSN